MKKLLVLLLFSTFSFFQNIRFEGVVQDNNNKAPLQMAPSRGGMQIRMGN